MCKTPYILLLVFIVSLSGCIIPGARQKRAELKLQANDSLFHVKQGDFDFRIVMPKDLMITNEPVFELGKNGEQLAIRCGQDFNIIAHKRSSTSIDLAAEQSKDRLFDYRVLDDEDASVVFSRVLPDGRIYDYRLIQYLKIGKQGYAFETADDAAFDLPQVLRMRSALASVQF
ncbi:MAG: hypothetical protein ACK478_11895 [Flavobacteriales bacterium]|jgi:hypothetical protein